MVAESVGALIRSSSPPEGYELMSNDDAVKAWLSSFGGAIASADYADDMIAAGYDSLDNMVFNAAELREAVNRMLPGHAARIARDASSMQSSMIGMTAKMTHRELSSPNRDNNIPISDAMKLAGQAPSFPAGTGVKPVSRARVEEWLDKVIAWSRIWSISLSDGLIAKRDNDKREINTIRSSYNIQQQHEILLGTQIMSTIGYNEKVYISIQKKLCALYTKNRH